jgi:hypothetical protein
MALRTALEEDNWARKVCAVARIISCSSVNLNSISVTGEFS